MDRAPGFSYAAPPPARPQFRSALGNDAEKIDPASIATAVRAVMNGVLVTDRAVSRLEREPVTAADVLLGRVTALVDFAALDRAQEGVARLEALLGSDGTVVFECADHSVASLRELVTAAAAAVAPYRDVRRAAP